MRVTRLAPSIRKTITMKHQKYPNSILDYTAHFLAKVEDEMAFPLSSVLLSLGPRVLGAVHIIEEAQVQRFLIFSNTNK